jgi:hypothetical protein
MVELAREVGGEDHSFRVIQLPFNIAMPEAATLPNETMDGEWMPMVEAAKRLAVNVVASASLLQGRIKPQTAIQFARSNPGITTALIGMSRVKHVEENLAADLR